MRICDLIGFLEAFNPNDEIAINSYDAVTGKLLDTTYAITFEENSNVPTLKIDIECP